MGTVAVLLVLAVSGLLSVSRAAASDASGRALGAVTPGAVSPTSPASLATGANAAGNVDGQCDDGTRISGDKKVIDELLDILRHNNQITDEQYRELKKKAEAEQVEELRKQAEQAKPAEVVKPAPGTIPMRAYWKEGFHLGTSDGAFDLKIGGRVHNDWAVTHQDSGLRTAFGLDKTDSGTEFRRARIELSGVLYERFRFALQLDFANADVVFKDVYVRMRGVPFVQSVQVGHFKEPFSLEELTSSNDITFMERSLPNVFAPSRHTGLGTFATALDERLTWAAGVFYDTDDAGNGFGADNYDLTARVTGLPWFAADGGNLLHLGLGYSHEFRDDLQISYAQRPEAHLFPARIANTGSVATNGVDLIGPEVALLIGRFSAQAEYQHAFVNQVAAPGLSFGGWYVFVSYFLTDDHRPYDRARGVFGRVQPRHNFLADGNGWGAWEIAARFSRLDLDSENVRGGVLDDITVGTNWYLNPNLRLEGNYVRGHLESVGNGDIAEGRFQLAF